MTELEVHSVYTVEPRLVVTLLAQSPALIWSARRVRIIAHYVLYITISICGHLNNTYYGRPVMPHPQLYVCTVVSL